MKRVLIFGIVLLGAVTAFAQMPSVGFGVHGNYASLSIAGPLKDAYGPGYGGGAHLDVHFAMLALRVSGDYISFSPDNDKYHQALVGLLGTAAQGFKIDGGGISIWSGNVNLKTAFLPLPILTPYITGGIGLASIGVGDATVTLNGVPQGNIPGVKGETKTSFNLGAGVDLKVGITLFIEAKYTWILTEGETSTYIPISAGITF
jgi:opacity protein-like surface antigen